MILRMAMHSAVFTVAIATGAMVLNTAGILTSQSPESSAWSSYDRADSDDDSNTDFQWNRWGDYDD